MTTKNKTENKNAAAAVLSALAAEAPPIQLANVKPLEAWQPDPFNPARPSVDWDSATLGKFAANAARRSAEHAWELGRALKLAKTVTKREGIKFGEWAETWVPNLKERTRQRYMKLGELDYDDVKAKGLDEVYRLLFGKKYAGEDSTTEATPPTPPATDSPPPTDEKEVAEAKVGEWSERYGPLHEQEAALVNAKNVLEDLMANPEEWKDVIDYYRDDLKTLAENLLKFLANEPNVAN
jgi:hypothetical protein